MPEKRQNVTASEAAEKAIAGAENGPGNATNIYFSGFDEQPVYRKLWPSEVNRVEEHLLRLTPEDRQMRFCGGVSDGRIREYCTEINWTTTTMLGCFVDGKLRGVACVVVLPEGFNFAAEIAFSVEGSFQNRGIGTMLVKKSISIARNRYVGTAYLFCLRENGKMRHIAGKFEAEFSYVGADVEGKVSPNWPSYLSYFEEAELDGHTIWQAAFPTEQ
ncbi:MAG: GNAT family N-acetyltransferase [Rhodospirillales bacterium]|nr:GNAT family N-acetyltransferase [Rhodospirillales bacterium]